MLSLEVSQSSFNDWNRMLYLMGSRVSFVVNTHPMTGAEFFDLNSLVIDGERAGEKLSDHLLEHGLSDEMVIIIHLIYGDVMRPRVPLRLLLSYPTARIISPYFNNPVWWNIAFDKSLGGRLLFIYSDEFYEQLSDFIRSLMNELRYCNE